MKFWKTLRSSGNTLDRRKNKGKGDSQRAAAALPPAQPASTPQLRQKTLSCGGGGNRPRSGNSDSTASFYEEFTSPLEVGTTFVELIKRQGSYLGVVVSTDEERPPKIQDLIPGSWAQRSDVLCVGDVVVGVNGIQAASVTRQKLKQILDDSDRIQLEVNYRLPPIISSHSSGTIPKLIQVTLKKENGSFGMVIRGGDHEVMRKRRPFTVFGITPGGPTASEGTLRCGDRIRAINGISLSTLKLPELQSMLYQQDKEAVFTVEYDVMISDNYHTGPLMIEIRREVGDILGFGLNKNPEDGSVYVESVKAASLADRCGAVNVGDVLLAVNGVAVAKLDVDQVTQLIRGGGRGPTDPTASSSASAIVQLEIMPGMFSRNSGHFYRASMPSPYFSTLNTRRHNTPDLRRRPCSRHRSMTEGSMINANNFIHAQTPSRERRQKFVSFTVELLRDSGPLGLTLATEDEEEPGKPIFISALQEDGLAERTKTIQLNDQLLEVNGVSVTSMSLNEVIPLLQDNSRGSDVIKLKLARLISIPERDFSATGGTLRRSVSRKPPLPSPSPCRTSLGSAKSSPVPAEMLGTTLYQPRSSPARSQDTGQDLQDGSVASGSVHDNSSVAGSTSSIKGAVPMEVHRVTLFKDNVYEDFGFSVSDGLYEKGIFVNRIRASGPADLSGMLRPLDRILQINNTRTVDYDCCLAVPLIAASAGDKIELLVSRATRVFELRDRSRDSLERAFRNYHQVLLPSRAAAIAAEATDDDATVRGCDSPRSLASNYSLASNLSQTKSSNTNGWKRLSRSKSTSNAAESTTAAPVTDQLLQQKQPPSSVRNNSGGSTSTLTKKNTNGVDNLPS